MNKERISLSFPCVYPVCPLSIDHARVYIIGDIWARYYRGYGKKVLFPLGFHYSGLTAQKFHKDLNSTSMNETKRIFNEIYQCNSHIIRYFKQNPRHILDYYSFQTLQELKKVNVSADYDEFYITLSEQYDNFVRTFFKFYEKNGVIIKNGNNIQLDYNQKEWRTKMLTWSEGVSTISEKEKAILLNAKNDLQNGWDILKEVGYGTTWKDLRIIDSMHDSELLSLYDIVNYVSQEEGIFSEDDMEILFQALSNAKAFQVPPKVERVLEWLPTSLMVMEEHLKVWFIKKLYAESLLLNESYRTKRFFVLGLGMREGKRMSSSRGNAILLQDLLRYNDPIKARMILLMVGGQASNFYNYEDRIIDEADRLLTNFRYFVRQTFTEFIKQDAEICNMVMKSIKRKELETVISDSEYCKTYLYKIEDYLLKGYAKQCLLEVMSIIPKIFKNYDLKTKINMLQIINYYVEILLGVNIVEV